MSDDIYLPRHISFVAEDYTSNLLSRLSNAHQNSSSEKPKSPKRSAPVRKPTKKRPNVDELNAAYGLPKNLNQNFSKWFYGDVTELKTRPAPISGLHLSPIQSRIDVNLGSSKLKFLTQELGQRDTEPFGMIETCKISTEYGKSGQDSAISLVLESNTTIVDRRPALRKQKQLDSGNSRSKSESLIAIEEDCDDTSDEEGR